MRSFPDFARFKLMVLQCAERTSIIDLHSMVLITKNDPLPIGAELPPFQLSDTRGLSVSNESSYSEGIRGLVVIFTCNHCPYVKGYEDRFIALARKTLLQGIVWLAINSNAANPAYPDDSFDEMVKRVSEKEYPFPYAADTTQEIARAFRAACTPEFFFFDADRRLRFTGRLDDENDAAKVTSHYLADAIDDLLSGRLIRKERAHPIGCSIKWL